MKLSVETAKQMGRNREPLCLRRGPDRISLSHLEAGKSSCLYIRAERARSCEVICAAVADRRPNVNSDSIQSRGAFFYISPGQAELVTAWFDGYYGDAA